MPDTPPAVPDEAADPREQLGRVFHEQGRLTVNAERERPSQVEPWEGRTPEQREIDMRGASAVAAQAVRDAGLASDRRDAQLFALRSHLPAILDALTFAVANTDTKARARRYEAALEALGGGEEPS